MKSKCAEDQMDPNNPKPKRNRAKKRLKKKALRDQETQLIQQGMLDLRLQKEIDKEGENRSVHATKCFVAGNDNFSTKNKQTSGTPTRPETDVATNTSLPSQRGLNRSDVAARLAESTRGPIVSNAHPASTPPSSSSDATGSPGSTNESDDIVIGSLLLLLWRSNRGGMLVGSHAISHLHKLHCDLLENELISGDFPKADDAITAARCFLQSDANGAEAIKRQIWSDQFMEAKQAEEVPSDDLSEDDDYHMLDHELYGDY